MTRPEFSWEAQNHAPLESPAVYESAQSGLNSSGLAKTSFPASAKRRRVAARRAFVVRGVSILLF